MESAATPRSDRIDPIINSFLMQFYSVNSDRIIDILLIEYRHEDNYFYRWWKWWPYDSALT